MRGVPHWILTGAMLGALALPGCGRREYTALPPTAVPNPVGKGSVIVTVIDGLAKPVAGARVGIRQSSGAPVGDAVTTDAQGKVSINVPFGTDYELSVQQGAVSAFRSGIAVDSESPVELSIALVASGGEKASITGSVADGLTGAPLDGATVSVLGTQNTVKAAADGSFLLKGVAIGNPVVVAIIKGYEEIRRPLTVRAGQLERLDLRLYPTGNGARRGHTLVSGINGVYEVDRAGSVLWNARTGAFQARALANGNVLLAGSQGVTEVNQSPTVVWNYKPLGLGRLNGPQAVWRTNTGNTWIADTGNNRVLEVSATQRLQRVLKASLLQPMSVERLEATASTLIADTGHHRVIETADDGRIVWSLGDGTTGLLNHPTFATRLPNGNTLIADSGNHRVLEVNRQLQLVWIHGGKGDRATCYLPNAASRLPNGNTLIADTGNDRVIEVNQNGAMLWNYNGVPQPLFAERL